jgi:hypothetical protein
MQKDSHADPDPVFSWARIFGQDLDVLFEKNIIIKVGKNNSLKYALLQQFRVQRTLFEV